MRSSSEVRRRKIGDVLISLSLIPYIYFLTYISPLISAAIALDQTAFFLTLGQLLLIAALTKIPGIAGSIIGGRRARPLLICFVLLLISEIYAAHLCFSGPKTVKDGSNVASAIVGALAVLPLLTISLIYYFLKDKKELIAILAPSLPHSFLSAMIVSPAAVEVITPYSNPERGALLHFILALLFTSTNSPNTPFTRALTLVTMFSAYCISMSFTGLSLLLKAAKKF